MIVDCAVYEGGRRRDGALPVHEAMEACREPGAFTWIGLYEPTEEEFDSIRREFALHELAVEDAIHAHQRPKLEVYGDMVFIVLKTARYIRSEEHTSELQSRLHLVCRLLLEKKKPEQTAKMRDTTKP